MLDQKYRLEIRLLKFQDYIRRKPNSPFGYYGLGVQYMLSGKPAAAERMFSHALKIDPLYTPAKLGRLEILLYTRKYLAATRYYQKNADCFKKKNIYGLRIGRATSQLYCSRSFFRHMGNMRSTFVFGERFGMLQKMFDSNTGNLVAALLLAMHFLKQQREDARAHEIYRSCVQMPGLNDKLRWDLVQILSKEQPAILEDPAIACMFEAMPDGVGNSEYASFLLSQFIKQQDQDKVLKAFSELQKKHLYPDRKTLWQYIYFCRKKNLWTPLLTNCCQRLLSCGWVDGLLADTVRELKVRGLAENTREMDALLSLYGYL